MIPAIGAKEAIFNLNLAFLDPGDVALRRDPGYPVYTGGPLLAGGDPVAMPLVPELGFVPDLDAIARARPRARAKVMYLNYPNNPTGALAPEGFFERVVAFAREHDILVVHDNSYSEIDLRRPPPALVPRDPRREGGRHRGVLALQGLQHDRLAVRGGGRKRARRSSTTGA